MACTDGTEVTAPIVVSACNPHDTFLSWLRDPPPQATSLVERWRAIPHDDGYESKIDAIARSGSHAWLTGRAARRDDR